jgi:hypothetical protein
MTESARVYPKTKVHEAHTLYLSFADIAGSKSPNILGAARTSFLPHSGFHLPESP